MKRLFLFSAFLVAAALLRAQPDTIGRFDAKGKRTGYHTYYYDSAFAYCEADKAAYRFYMPFERGKIMLVDYSVDAKNYTAEYIPADSAEYGDTPLLLNGEVVYWSEGRDCYRKTYRKGIPVSSSHRSYLAGDSAGRPYSENLLWHDSLENGKARHPLHYYSTYGIPVWKAYDRKLLHSGKYTYLNVASRHDLFAPRIGYTQQCRHFAELGISWKQSPLIKHHGLSGTHVYDNFFPGVTVSMLGSWNENRDYIGGKAVFSYTAVFLCPEIGIVNYVGDKRSDLRATIGCGITLSGMLSILYHYSHPLLENPFTDISRHSVSIVLF